MSRPMRMLHGTHSPGPLSRRCEGAYKRANKRARRTPTRKEMKMPVSIYRHAKSLDAAQQGRSALRVSAFHDGFQRCDDRRSRPVARETNRRRGHYR